MSGTRTLLHRKRKAASSEAKHSLPSKPSLVKLGLTRSREHGHHTSPNHLSSVTRAGPARTVCPTTAHRPCTPYPKNAKSPVQMIQPWSARGDSWNRKQQSCP